MISRDVVVDTFMDEVITELERMLSPLVSAGVKDIDVEELSMRALNTVRTRYGYPPTTDRPSLTRKAPA